MKNMAKGLHSSEPRRILCCVVNWNGLSDTIECLESILRLDYPDFDVLVVDNGSLQDEAAAIEKRFEGRVATLRSARNEGFAGGANKGINYARKGGYQYVLLLNNDCVVAANLLSELGMTIASAPDIAMVGPLVCSYYQRDVVSSAGMLFGTCSARGRRLRVGARPDEMPQTPYEVDCVDGCCMLVSIAAIDAVGFLDTIFFVYWDEIDWCARFRRAGFRVLCSPSTTVWHKLSRSAGGFSSELYVYAFLRNQLLFVRRNPRAFCAVPRCVEFVRVSITSLAYNVLQRRHEGPKALFRLAWLVLSAVKWNAAGSPDDPLLLQLVSLRENAILSSI